MDIEDVAHKTPELIKTQPVDIFEGVTDAMAENLADFLLFKGDLKAKAAQEIKNLWKMFLQVSCVLSVMVVVFKFIIFLFLCLIIG